MIEIRKYSQNDINVINSMGKNLHDDYLFKLDDFSDCMVACNENKVLGFITYSIIYERAEIIDIYISDSFRNNGIARSLIDEVINIVTKNNCINITLEVAEDNLPAINLYKSFGFEVVGIRNKYYNNANGLLMKRDLE